MSGYPLHSNHGVRIKHKKIKYIKKCFSPHLPLMTITSIRKKTKKGSASRRYTSQMALNTFVSQATIKRLRSLKKKKVMKKPSYNLNGNGQPKHKHRHSVTKIYNSTGKSTYLYPKKCLLQEDADSYPSLTIHVRPKFFRF